LGGVSRRTYSFPWWGKEYTLLKFPPRRREQSSGRAPKAAAAEDKMDESMSAE
jgi:hypothetical protein